MTLSMLEESAPFGRDRFASIALLTALTAGMWQPLSAVADDVLEEVTVTAQKREQSLQNVGISITAVQASDLRDLGIVDSKQLGAALPGLQLNSASGGNYGAQLTIRGVASTDFSAQQESPNSMYIDEVYISAANMQGAGLFDMQRVEALRGPQGTLFGRNSTGGLVSFVTNKPTEDTEGYVDLTYGDFNQIRVEAAAGGALADGINGRIAIVRQKNDGYVENNFPGAVDLNGTDYKGIRLAVEFDRIDNLEALLSVTYTHDDDREGFYGHVNTYFDPNNSGRPSPLPADVDAYGTGPGNDAQGYRSPYRSASEANIGYVGFMRRSAFSPTLHLDWDLGGNTTLTSVSNFTKFSFDYAESCSGAPQTTCKGPLEQDLKQWSQELRLAGNSGALTWVGGVYALGIGQHIISEFDSPYYTGTPFAFHTINPINQQLHSQAIFGQVEYFFTDNWRATLGVRATHDRKSFNQRSYLIEAGDFDATNTVFDPPLLLADFSKSTVGNQAVASQTFGSGKAQMDYIINSGSLLYASISRGVKGAGFNSNANGATSDELTPFKSEHVTAYEVGEKLTLFGNRVTLNGALFYYDYSDFQAFQYRNGPNPFVSNSDARFSGGEIELTARPIQGLDIRLALSRLSSAVYDVATAHIGITDQLAQDAPKWSGNGSIRYSWQAGPGTAAVILSSDFVSGRFHSVDNTPAVHIHGSSGQNVRGDYSVGPWTFSAFANNVLDHVRETGAYDLTGSFGYAITSYMPPRWWGVQARYEF